MMAEDTFEDVEIPDWEPPERKLCKHYEQDNICMLNGDRRVIALDWCRKCNHYTPGEIIAPKPERKETTLMPRGRVGKVDWNQPADKFFAGVTGLTLREYLKQKVQQDPGKISVYAEQLGVTPGALRQAIERNITPTSPTAPIVERKKTNPRWPNGIDWNIQAPRVVGTTHKIKPIGVTLINWCSDCLDEECYTLEELAEAISCTPAELQAALDEYQAEPEEELDEEEPEAECVNPENNIPADYTPTETSDIDGFSIDPPAPQIGEALPHGVTRVGAELIADGQWHTTMLSALAETAPDALSAFLRVTGQEDLFRGFMLGYEARGEEAA